MKCDSAWAEEEFGEADLGDERRTARLVELATTLGQQPSASLPAATEDWAALKAAYRFFDNDCVRAKAMLASHVESTRQRLQQVPLALAVQDTTYLDWTDHEATTGLGPLAAATHQGLLAHTTLLLTPERVPGSRRALPCWMCTGGRSRCVPPRAKSSANCRRSRFGRSGRTKPRPRQACRRSNGCC